MALTIDALRLLDQAQTNALAYDVWTAWGKGHDQDKIARDLHVHPPTVAHILGASDADIFRNGRKPRRDLARVPDGVGGGDGSRPLTPKERDAEVVRLRATGMTPKAIAEKLGILDYIARNAIQHARANGAQFPAVPRGYAPADNRLRDAGIISDYRAGMKTKHIRNKWNVPESTMYGVLREAAARNLIVLRSHT